jgi:hypothetical protein
MIDLTQDLHEQDQALRKEDMGKAQDLLSPPIAWVHGMLSTGVPS